MFTVCVCLCVCVCVRVRVCVVQCHTGILGGGHYVTYAKNPNNKWYCYNDSSCKVSESLPAVQSTHVAYVVSADYYDKQGCQGPHCVRQVRQVQSDCCVPRCTHNAIHYYGDYCHLVYSFSY